MTGNEGHLAQVTTKNIHRKESDGEEYPQDSYPDGAVSAEGEEKDWRGILDPNIM